MKTPDGQDFSELQKSFCERFDGVAHDPEAWVSSGDALASATDLLRPAVDAYWVRVAAVGKALETGGAVAPPSGVEIGDVLPVHLMLSGMAAECYLKAALIRKKGLSALKSGTLARELSDHGHQLLSVASEIGLALEPKEELLLWRMSAAITWAGRYPMPKTVWKWEPQYQTSEDPSVSRRLLAKFRDAAQLVPGTGEERAKT